MLSPEKISITIFVVSYAGIALGSIPGLALDRTGIALLGAIAMVATGVLNIMETGKAIDIPTILLLYSLMILSAQFNLSGFYTRIALGIVRYMKAPAVFLFLLMGSAALLSALVVNDIVCLALTPVVCVALLEASLNPAPFLIGLACASNIGSASTIIGNPQNMLIGQVGRLDFAGFLLWCFPPSLISLAAAYLIILLLYRDKWHAGISRRDTFERKWPELDSHQAKKGFILWAVLIVLFFTRIPREISALSLAGILLCSRRIKTRALLGMVDWHLITLFCGLFIIVAGIQKYGLPRAGIHFLESKGFDINRPFTLSWVTLLLSNMVSNVPAVMLLLKNIAHGSPSSLYLLSLFSTYAGNFFILGSIANLITFEQARKYDIVVGFWEHARTGVPVTMFSLAAALVWGSLLL